MRFVNAAGIFSIGVRTWDSASRKVLLKRTIIIVILFAVQYLNASEVKSVFPAFLNVEIVGQRAHFMLGKMYLKGEDCQKNPLQARKHFKKAALQSYDEVVTAWASIELAKIYALRLGVSAKLEKAMAYVKKARVISLRLLPQMAVHEVCPPLDQISKVADILQDCSFDVNRKDELGRTQLHWACEQGEEEAAGLLLLMRAEVDARNNKQETPLHMASFRGHRLVVELLIAHGADIEAASVIDDGGGWRPLLWACCGGREEIVDLLLACRANVLVAAANGWSPLHAAADKGYCEIAKKLLAAGVDISATKINNTCVPLHAAARKGHVQVADVLLIEAKKRQLIDHINMYDKDGFSPLHLLLRIMGMPNLLSF